MNVLIAGNFPYPSGAASSARIYNISKGFEANNCKVWIIPYKKFEYPNDNLGGKDFGNVFYIENNSDPSQNLLTKSISWFQYNSLLTNYIHEFILSHKIDLIYFYGESYFLINSILNKIKELRIIKVLHIVEDRFKMVNIKNIIFDPLILDILLGSNYLPRRMDLLCCISFGLFEKYKLYKRKLILSGIEDFSRDLDLDYTISKDIVNIIYLGALTERDNPDFLLFFLKKMKSNGIPVKLHLIGKYFKEINSNKRALAIETEFPRMVILHGELNNSQLISFCMNATFFLLPRLDNVAERMAFPTRVLEFIKFKKVIILEKVGDLDTYFKHMENAFLFYKEEFNVEEFKLLINSKSIQLQLIQNATNTGKQYFDRKSNIQKLIYAVKKI
ncbi:MAG: glycosyltransferase family 4 protein [Saprospiraceae bacterium]|nr:glycosyltransferase family 4 protein [Saprospiraceae bacterium]